jgi:SEC-C motif-containing protein
VDPPITTNAAFAKGDEFYRARPGHPRTRPADLSMDPSLTWTGLEILGATGDTVDFVANYVDAEGPGSLREHSRFARRAGRWMYVDGDVG